MRGFFVRNGAAILRLFSVFILVVAIVYRPDAILLAPYKGQSKWLPYVVAAAVGLLPLAMAVDAVAVAVMHRLMGRRGSPWRSVRRFTVAWMSATAKRAASIRRIRDQRLSEQELARARRRAEEARRVEDLWRERSARFTALGLDGDRLVGIMRATAVQARNGLRDWEAELRRYAPTMREARRFGSDVQREVEEAFFAEGAASAESVLARERRYVALREQSAALGIPEVTEALAMRNERRATSLLEEARDVQRREDQLAGYERRVQRLPSDRRDLALRCIASARQVIRQPREFRMAIYPLSVLFSD